MNIHIHSPGVRLGSDLLGCLDGHLRRVLGRYSARIQSVQVFLADINGHRGGPDQRCRLVARLRPSGELVLEDVHQDVSAAVGRAADRLVSLIRQELERRHAARRRQATRRLNLR